MVLMKEICYHLTSLVAVLTGLVCSRPHIAQSGRAHEEVDRRIASASRAFGALRQPIFEDPDLSITTMQEIHLQSLCLISTAVWK